MHYSVKDVLDVVDSWKEMEIAVRKAEERLTPTDIIRFSDEIHRGKHRTVVFDVSINCM